MASGKSVFGNIKSKLGLETPSTEYVEEELDYDEYDDYEDEPEDDSYTTRRSSERSSYSTRGGSSLPRLVTMDDARESARYSSSSRESSRRSSAVRSYGRDMVDSSLPPSMTPEGTAAVSAASNRRSEGLDSLFSSTTSSHETNSSSLREPTLPIMEPASTAVSTSIPNLGVASINLPGKRQLQVIRPNIYDDVENVTKVLKASDVVILSLSAVSPDLMKRMLDFSFGAASALDASVEAIGNKVFAITRGMPLSDAERDDLHSTGVI